MRLIINADDCGKSTDINAAIEKFIKAGKITSTTIMANMGDLKGAKRLFDKYNESISFGIHLNLTEGHPLSYSQELLDKGYYQIIEDQLYFNVNSHRNYIGNSSVLKNLEIELSCQIERILDLGIQISHIDSHHHIHTGLIMIRLLPKLAKRYNLNRVRILRNFAPNCSNINLALRNFWKKLIRYQNRQILMTDYFGIYEEWYDSGKPNFTNNKTVELMCHPGGSYVDEEKKLLETDFSQLKNLHLINYNHI